MRALAIAIVLSTAAGGDARAEVTPEDKARALALFEQGTRAFNLGDYQTALPMFQRAYQISGAAAFLFNIGQCYRMMHHPTEAAREYRAFLREQPDAPNRDDVEKRIKDMEREAAEQQAAKPPTGVQAPGINETPPPTDGRPSRTGLWIGVGVGAAVIVVTAVVLGVVLGVRTHPEAPSSTLGNYSFGLSF